MLTFEAKKEKRGVLLISVNKLLAKKYFILPVDLNTTLKKKENVISNPW